MDNLEDVNKANIEADQAVIDCSLEVVKNKIQLLAANFDTLSVKDLAKELKELGKFGAILTRHKK